MTSTRTRSAAGFTLVELVVASTLMVLVLSGVYLTFTTAVRSWRSAELDYSTYEDARRALGLFEREIHGIPADALHLTRGTADSIEFVTLTQPLDVQTASSERLLRVTYRFAGGRSGGELIREEAPVLGPLPLPPAPPGHDLPAGLKVGARHRFVIASGVRSFGLEYGWAGPQSSSFPGTPPGPARIATDTSTLYALPEVIGAALELDDPGDLLNRGRSVFRTRITFRGPTSPMPEALRKRAGL
jgi:prepilin-type N-terminal cleavage/methylation domain-containing protein